MRPTGSLALAVAIVLGITLTGCGDAGSTPQSQPSSGFQVVSPGVLTVVTSLPAPGFWNGDDPGSIDGGYEYAMAQEIARRVGLGKVVVRNVSFDSLVAGQLKDFDLALSTINITPEREKVVDFSVPYFSSDQGVLVRKGTKVTSENARGLRWAVQQASTSDTYLRSEIKPTAEPRVFQDFPAMFAALAANQVDAVLLDTVQVLAQAKESRGTLEVVGQYRTGGVYGALFPQSSPNREIVNKIIEDMKADGTLAKLGKQWLEPQFGADPATVPYLEP